MGNTWKVDDAGQLVPIEQWQAQQAQRARGAEIDRYIEVDPGDIYMPPPQAQIVQNQPSMMAAYPTATHHQTTEKTDPERQAKGFLLMYGLGILPLHAILSGGLIWVVSGTFNGAWFLLLWGALCGGTWLWGQKNTLNHSGAGIRRHEVTQQAEIMRQASDQAYELAKMKIERDDAYRREQLKMKWEMMTNG